MVTSAGIIFTDGYYFLIGHATGTKHWSIPKGKIEQGEDPKSAALREFFEECGLNLADHTLEYLGLYKYRQSKKLELFKCYVKNIDLYKVEDFECISFIDDDNIIPEMDRFKYITFDEMQKYLNKNQYLVLESIVNKLKETE